MEYKTKKLKDFAKVEMGQSPKSEFYNVEGLGIPFLQGVRTFGDIYPSIDTYTTKSHKIAEKGDILFTVRAPVGDINIAPTKLCIGRGLAAISSNNQKFLYYLLKNNKTRYENLSTGTIYSSINKKTLENMEFLIPDSNTQKQITKILYSFDKKIEINNKVISNLEEQAQVIFKSWFVDFEPFQDGEFVESELGMIPEGWEVISLYSIANYKNGLAMQKFRPEKGAYSLPVLKIKELRANRTDGNSDRCATDISSEVIVEDGDIIFSWSGSLLVEIWTGGKAGLNQHLFKVTSDRFEKWFYYSWINYRLHAFISIARDRATTMGHIKISHLKEEKILVPNEKTLLHMNGIMEPIIKIRTNLGIQNRKLEEIRDALLPKLMSGEIDVSGINIDLEDGSYE